MPFGEGFEADVKLLPIELVALPDELCAYASGCSLPVVEGGDNVGSLTALASALLLRGVRVALKLPFLRAEVGSSGVRGMGVCVNLGEILGERDEDLLKMRGMVRR